MASKRGRERKDETPRTDLPPEREPHDEGYFGTEEEEGVEREREAGDDGEEGERERDAGPGRGPARDAAEDAAGGDRGIV